MNGDALGFLFTFTILRNCAALYSIYHGKAGEILSFLLVVVPEIKFLANVPISSFVRKV